MPDHQHLDHIDGHVLASARPVQVGAGARISGAGGVSISEAVDELFERDEIHLEDVVVEVRATRAPVVVGLGAVVYLHPDVSVQRVSVGGAAYLAEGAVIEDVDEVALTRGDITLTPWRVHAERGADG